MRSTSRVVAALAAVVSLVTAGCATQVSGTAVPLGSSDGGGGAPAEPVRMTPEYGQPPITFDAGEQVESFRQHYLTGLYTTTLDPVEFMIGFRVQESARDDSELLDSNMELWKEKNVQPTEFEVDGVPGYWGDMSFDDPGEEPTTQRFYIAAKGAVTVTLTMSAPTADGLPEDVLDLGDQVFTSVQFDETTLTGKGPIDQAPPVVPFSLEVPAELGEELTFEFATVYWSNYVVAGRTIEVYVSDNTEAAKSYADRKKELEGTAARVFDLKDDRNTVDNLGPQIDEGLGTVPRHNGVMVLMYFMFRKGNLLVHVRCDGDKRELTKPVQDTVTKILTTTVFT